MGLNFGYKKSTGISILVLLKTTNKPYLLRLTESMYKLNVLFGVV